jgi:hypothetical protein
LKVFLLASALGRGDGNTRGPVGQPDGGFELVPVLTARPGAPVSVNLTAGQEFLI